MSRMRVKMQNDLDEAQSHKGRIQQELIQVRNDLQLSMEHGEALRVLVGCMDRAHRACLVYRFQTLFVVD